MKTIVIVDNDERIRKVLDVLIHLWLKKRQIQADIIMLNNGAEAYDWIDEHGKPYMLLLDVRMPVMSGSELLKKLASQGVDVIDRTLIVTGYADDLEDHLGSRQAMLLCFLRKPFTAEELYTELDKISPDAG